MTTAFQRSFETTLLAALLAVAIGSSPVIAREDGAADVPARLEPVPPCRTASELGAEGLERLRRFTVIPDGYGQWRERDCFPPRLDRNELGRTAEPHGTIVAVAGRDAVVVDPGSSWLVECDAAGLPASAVRRTTGADLLSVIDEIARHTDLATVDIREIGLAMGDRADGEGRLYALTLGTPRTVVRVQCFVDVEVLVDRAAAAMREARQATVW